MPLKLLKVKQSKQINRLSKRRDIVLNDENSFENMFNGVSKGGDIYVFSSLKIVISEKFKKCILDEFFFIDWFCLLAINEIYLIKE